MKTSTEINRAWPIFSLIILFVLAGANVFLSLFIVPKFEQIFQDALGPDHVLPGITQFIITARIPIALIALAWPVAAMIAIWCRYHAAVWIINLGYLIFFLVIGISIVALFMPMVVTITGVSGVSLSHPAASR